MTTRHVIDRDVLQLTFEGPRCPEEDLAATSDALQSRELEPGASLLLDFRASRSDRSREDIMALAATLRDGRSRLGDRAAILVSTPLQYGLARMLAAYAEAGGMKFNVFRDAVQARRWLRTGDDPGDSSPQGSPPA